MIQGGTGFHGVAKVRYSFPARAADVSLTSQCFIAFQDRLYEAVESPAQLWGSQKPRARSHPRPPGPTLEFADDARRLSRRRVRDPHASENHELLQFL